MPLLSITQVNDDYCEVKSKSPFSDKISTMTLRMSLKQYESYKSNDINIQSALPHLTPDEREFLKTGITPDEWNKLFSN